MRIDVLNVSKIGKLTKTISKFINAFKNMILLKDFVEIPLQQTHCNNSKYALF